MRERERERVPSCSEIRIGPSLFPVDHKNLKKNWCHQINFMFILILVSISVK